jgi:hypothetical protein
MEFLLNMLGIISDSRGHQSRTKSLAGFEPIAMRDMIKSTPSLNHSTMDDPCSNEEHLKWLYQTSELNKIQISFYHITYEILYF